MKILIVDDEDLARERLARLVSDLKIHEIVGEASNGIEALEKIESLGPDIVLLDIRMPGMDGLEVARHLVDKEEAPAVIFTTAYDEHALEAFKVNAVDYLLKPVKPASLEAALSKVPKPNKSQWQALYSQDGQPKARTHLSSRTHKGIKLIPVDEIIFLRANQKYIDVYFEGKHEFMSGSLKELEQEFPGRFLRIHRNCLVQLSFVEALEKDETGTPIIRLRGLIEALEVSRRHLALVRKIIIL